MTEMERIGRRPPYVPGSFSFTQEAPEKRVGHFGSDRLEPFLRNHFLGLGAAIVFFEAPGKDRVRDVFGGVWDRSVDKDIGSGENPQRLELAISGYRFPDPVSDRSFADIPARLEEQGDLFRASDIGFSLYARAWTPLGMENRMLDFIENPDFVRELFRAIADYNIAQIQRAATYADPSGVLLAGRTESGVPAAFEFTPYRSTNDWVAHARVAFESGSARISRPPSLAIHLPGALEIFRDGGRGGESARAAPVFPRECAMCQQARNFLADLRGEPSPLCGAEQAQKSLDLAREWSLLLG